VINVVAKLEGIVGEDMAEGDICACSFVNWIEGVMAFAVVMTITAVLGVISSIEVGNKGEKRWKRTLLVESVRVYIHKTCDQ